MAHSGSVNCLSIGKKTCRLFATGGDDQKVNVWSIGKSTSLMVSSKLEFKDIVSNDKCGIYRLSEIY